LNKPGERYDNVLVDEEGVIGIRYSVMYILVCSVAIEVLMRSLTLQRDAFTTDINFLGDC